MSFHALLRRMGRPLLWGVAWLALALAAWWLVVGLVPRPAVGIVHVEGDIWAGSTAFVRAQIEAARDDRRIAAVVVRFDSPGGEVVASQALFLALQDLRREMPAVGSIDVMAASGAYYAAMGTDPIYAKPSSAVGNVGVWALVPQELAVNEEVLTSGPFKLTGSSRDEFLREIEGIRREFVETVFSQRDERIDVSRAELSQGLLYPGREAARLGLIDHVGSEDDAIAAAARLAGIAHYEVIDLQERVAEEFYGNLFIRPDPWPGAADPLTGQRTLPHGIYLLYDTMLRGTP